MSTAIGTLIWLPAPNSSPRSSADGSGDELAERDADDHAEGDPERQVSLEEVEALAVCAGCHHVMMFLSFISISLLVSEAQKAVAIPRHGLGFRLAPACTGPVQPLR